MTEKDMALVTDWKTTNIDGWWYQEKIFDCRVMWDGKQFWTRDGNIVPAPVWFTRGLPDCKIDGGIYAGRRGFSHASAAVRFGNGWFSELAPDNTAVKFVAFDAPDIINTWDKRIDATALLIAKCPNACTLPFKRVEGKNWIDDAIELRKLGGEGFIFRNPAITRYETGRTKNLQRFKFCE